MTKRAFKEAMMRGLGRCILELDKAEDAGNSNREIRAYAGWKICEKAERE